MSLRGGAACARRDRRTVRGVVRVLRMSERASERGASRERGGERLGALTESHVWQVKARCRKCFAEFQ
eukprot:6477818-Prymnesium_polylepis.1